eukprot:623931_1
MASKITTTILAFLFIYLAQIKPCFPNVIDTNVTTQFKDAIVSCAEGEDCTVICDETEACYQANIYCPVNNACNIQCISNQSRGNVDVTHVCAQATFHCSDSTQCNVNCTNVGMSANGYACENAAFNWPGNKNYNLHCGTGAPCRGITIDPKYNNQPFSWHCYANYGEESCGEMTFNCPANSTCDISCAYAGACKHFTLNCETTGKYPCTASCDGFNACKQGIINGIGTVTSCSEVGSCNALIFPQPPSDVAYTLECNGKFSCSNAIIKCPADAQCHISCNGESSCVNTQIAWPTNISNASLTCADISACLNVIRPDGTVVFTFDPSEFPTSSPTISTFSPTTGPTSYPTFGTAIPTLSPSEFPTMIPTNVPTIGTAIPIFTPTAGPTLYPTSGTFTPSDFPTNNPTNLPTFGTPMLTFVTARSTVAPTIIAGEKVSNDVDLYITLAVLVIAIVLVLISIAAIVCVLKRTKQNTKPMAVVIQSDPKQQGGRQAQNHMTNTAGTQRGIVPSNKTNGVFNVANVMQGSVKVTKKSPEEISDDSSGSDLYIVHDKDTKQLPTNEDDIEGNHVVQNENMTHDSHGMNVNISAFTLEGRPNIHEHTTQSLD